MEVHSGRSTCHAIGGPLSSHAPTKRPAAFAHTETPPNNLTCPATPPHKKTASQARIPALNPKPTLNPSTLNPGGRAQTPLQPDASATLPQASCAGGRGRSGSGRGEGEGVRRVGHGGGRTEGSGVFRVSGFGFWVSGFGFGVWGFGVRVSGGGTCASSSAKMRVTICTSSSDAFSTTCHAPRGHPQRLLPPPCLLCCAPRRSASGAALAAHVSSGVALPTMPALSRPAPCVLGVECSHIMLPTRCCEFPCT